MNFFHLQAWIKKEIEEKNVAEVYYLAHAWRLNGIIDVWKNFKTVYCIPENEYVNYEADLESINAYVLDKLSKHEKQMPIKKLKSGKMSYQEFKNNFHQPKNKK